MLYYTKMGLKHECSAQHLQLTRKMGPMGSKLETSKRQNSKSYQISKLAAKWCLQNLNLMTTKQRYVIMVMRLYRRTVLKRATCWCCN